MKPAPGPGLPFDATQLLQQGIRVSQAEFARLVGVSRATVTGWKNAGLIDVRPDGKVDPAVAYRQMCERADPERIRAPLLRRAMEATSNAQARADALARQLAALQAETAKQRELADMQLQAMAYREQDAAAEAHARFVDELASRFAEAIEAHASGHLDTWLDELTAVEVYGWDLDAYRAEQADTDEERAGEVSRPSSQVGTSRDT